VCHAALVSKDEFLALHRSSIQAAYAKYRDLYQRFVPSVSHDEFETAAEKPYAPSGATFLLG
jgi:hypothetical protein